jgi:hypothetical protein
MTAFQLLWSQTACLQYHDSVALAYVIPIDAKERVDEASLAGYAGPVLVERAWADDS